MLIHARRYDTQAPVALQIDGNSIGSLDAAEDSSELPWIGPGLIDLQVNGYGGSEFTAPDLTVDVVRKISLAMDHDGVTSYLPTLTTQSQAILEHSLRVLAEAIETCEEVRVRAPGIHLEGPYLSSEDGPRGAHPIEHCRPPDWYEFQRFQEAAAGRIRILTLAPELPGAADFIARVAATGVIVAIGHTAANSEQVAAAVDAGASMSTHLGNGAHAQIRRHPNYLWDQLAEDRLTASLIADGHHLPPAVLKSFVRGKTPQRCVLVSDITGMAGMPPGRYDNSGLGSVEVLEDGRLVIPGQRQLLAGAALPLSVGVGHIMRTAELDLGAAMAMCSSRPAELLGLPPAVLAPGSPADLILFRLDDGPMEIQATLKRGTLVFGDLG